MIPDRLKATNPPAPVRAMLLGEVLVFVGAVAGAIWLQPAPGRAVRWYTIVLWVLAAVLAVGANILHGDRPRDSGLRVDNLAASAREAAGATAVLAACIAAAAVAGGGWHFERWPRFAGRSGEILAAACAQQYVLQAFMVRRLGQAGLGRVWVVALASALFAALHAPNVVLMAVTGAAGAIWCCLFLRQANLAVLGLSHGVLSLWLYYAWPKAWHLGLAVGPRALERMSRYWGG